MVSRRMAADQVAVFCGARLLARRSLPSIHDRNRRALSLGLFGVLTLVQRRPSRLMAFQAIAFFLGGALPLTMFLLWYQTQAFGGPFESGYRHLADRAYQPWHQGGFLGVGLPHWRALVLSFFSPLRGMFILSPGLLLACPGMLVLFRRSRVETELRPIAWTSLAVTLGYVYFTSAFQLRILGMDHWSPPSYPLVPFLLLPVALTLERARTTWLCGPCGVLLAASVLTTSALTFVNYIPADVSNALLALAIPLTISGDLSPSLLCFLGLQNPMAGAILWIGVFPVVAWLLWTLRPQRSFESWFATLCVAAILCTFQISSYQNSPSDQAALALLKQVWLAPPGRNLFL